MRLGKRKEHMLNSNGFDLWADGYDKSVNLSETADEYPFAGYKDVLDEIYNAIHERSKAKVLDIGFGTGVLTKKLYADGYDIYGIDFSAKMIEIARKKMPNAILMEQDFANGLPKEIEHECFDFIISTYAFHHLTDIGKAEFLAQLIKQISSEGMILIGDVAFETREKLDACKKRCGDIWDTDEVYIVFDEIKQHFKKDKIKFHKVSFCAGIVTLIK